MLGCVASRAIRHLYEPTFQHSQKRRDGSFAGLSEDALGLCKLSRALSLISRWLFSTETLSLGDLALEEDWLQKLMVRWRKET